MRHHKKRDHPVELAALEASGYVEPPTILPTMKELESLIPPAMFSAEIFYQS